mmetsp:Transcript_3964/g.3321  ORF Transcript_3964/g.3321 Transcript_3964/m.3321 type:complete len:95 (-) Transcript_3964:1114-1398(-)
MNSATNIFNKGAIQEKESEMSEFSSDTSYSRASFSSRSSRKKMQEYLSIAPESTFKKKLKSENMNLHNVLDSMTKPLTDGTSHNMEYKDVMLYK